MQVGQAGTGLALVVWRTLTGLATGTSPRQGHSLARIAAGTERVQSGSVCHTGTCGLRHAVSAKSCDLLDRQSEEDMCW